MILFTADTHFGHANIIRFCDRPFTDIEAMNETLIANWNRKVTNSDGGTRELWLNVTYNYGSLYHRSDVLGEKGIRAIYGMTGADSIAMLEKAASALGDDASADYWQPTEGNAKRPLLLLAAMAKMRPDGIWDGD